MFFFFLVNIKQHNALAGRDQMDSNPRSKFYRPKAWPLDHLRHWYLTNNNYARII